MYLCVFLILSVSLFDVIFKEEDGGIIIKPPLHLPLHPCTACSMLSSVRQHSDFC